IVGRRTNLLVPSSLFVLFGLLLLLLLLLESLNPRGRPLDFLKNASWRRCRHALTPSAENFGQDCRRDLRHDAAWGGAGLLDGVLLERTVSQFEIFLGLVYWRLVIRAPKEMFGKEPPENEAQSEDEDWGPNRRKRSKMEATTGTCMANPVNEDGSSNLALTAKISCDKKQLFRIPPDAVEVSKWFKNARYAALRMRKNETTNAVKNQDTSISMNESLSEDLDLPGRRVSKSFRQVSGRRMLVLERTFNKGGTGCQLDEKTDSEQLYLTEVERLCRLEDKLQSLKKTLLSCMDEDKQTTKTCVREENVIYVPVAELLPLTPSLSLSPQNGASVPVAEQLPPANTANGHDSILLMRGI
ncbi:Homeobox domain, partial [Musa troglodytarum]